MKKVKDTQYVFITPFVRAKEAKLLGWEQVQRMLEMPTAAEAARFAADYGYTGLEPLEAARLEKALNARRGAAFGELRALMPQQAVLDAFCLNYDYHNAKTLVKAAASGQDARRLLSGAGRVPAELFAESFEKGEFLHIPAALAAAVQAAAEILARTEDPQMADLVLDKACYAEMTALAKEAGSKFLAGYAALNVDSANLRAILRAKRMGKDYAFLAKLLLPGGSVEVDKIISSLQREQPVTALYAGLLAPAAEAGEQALSEGGGLGRAERLCDRALQDYLGDAALIAFGEQPVISYICAVEKEIRTVRTVLAGRLAGMTAEQIRERLRENDG